MRDFPFLLFRSCPSRPVFSREGQTPTESHHFAAFPSVNEISNRTSCLLASGRVRKFKRQEKGKRASLKEPKEPP